MHTVANKARVDVVIELGRTACRLVTFRAILAQSTSVHVVSSMTAVAIDRAELVTAIAVAFGALHDAVVARQREARISVVIEDDRLEVLTARVTLAARRAKLALVHIDMTRCALWLKPRILDRAPTNTRLTELSGLVAAAAVEHRMRSVERKTRHRMIEVRRPVPAPHMTALAVFEAELSAVRFIVPVTVRALGRGETLESARDAAAMA